MFTISRLDPSVLCVGKRRDRGREKHHAALGLDWENGEQSCALQYFHKSSPRPVSDSITTNREPEQ